MPTMTEILARLEALEERCQILENRCDATESRCDALKERCDSLALEVEDLRGELALTDEIAAEQALALEEIEVRQ
jgi:hypothetical protein